MRGDYSALNVRLMCLLCLLSAWHAEDGGSVLKRN